MTTNSQHDPPEADGAPDPDFETALGELEQIVQQLESGMLGLEPSLARFEQGIALLRRCYETLEKAEQRIELLTGFDADGNAVTAAFPAAAELDVTIEVERTEIEVVRSPEPEPRARSVEHRRREREEPEDRDRGPTLF
jgi:exodeoxyribonuclease VII small subunit